VDKYERGRQALDDNIIWRMRIACRTRIENTYCSSTAKNVTRTSLGVRFIRTLPVLCNVVTAMFSLGTV